MVSIFKECPYVHIRQYEHNKSMGTSFPTKMGVSFKPIRFANLLTHLDEIKEATDQMEKGIPNIDMKIHLGGGVYAAINSAFTCINFRKYFIPDGMHEEIPTRMGIALRISEWKEFLVIVDKIKSLSPELRNIEPCYMSLDHSNLMGFLNCNECNPFGDKLS